MYSSVPLLESEMEQKHRAEESKRQDPGGLPPVEKQVEATQSTASMKGTESKCSLCKTNA